MKPYQGEKWFLRLSVLLTALLGNVVPGFAGELIVRTVDASDGSIVPFSTVIITPKADDSLAGEHIADSRGVVRISDVLGSFQVAVRAPGFQEWASQVELGSSPVEVVAPLVRTDERLEEVEVTGQRGQIEAARQSSMHVIRTDAARSLPSLGEFDPVRLVQLLPGVQAASDLSSGLYIRGGSPDHTLVLLDGVPVYNPSHAFGLFSTFNGDAIDQVRLYKGAYPARFGGRLGSVLQVDNRAPSSPTISGQGGVSTITGRLTLEGPVGSGRWLLGARRTYLEPLLNALRDEDNEIPEYYFYDLNGRLAIPSLGPGTLTSSGYLGQDDLFFDLDEDSFLDIRWGNRTASTEYNLEIGPNTVLRSQVAASEYDSTTRLSIFTTPIEFNNRIVDLSWTSDLTWRRDNHEITTGLAASRYDFEYRETFNADDQTLFGAEPYDVSWFVDDQWTRDDGSIYGFGLRLRYFSEESQFLAEPRVSTSFLVGDDVRLKVAGGIFHQYVQLVSTEGFSAGDFYLPIADGANPSRSIQGVIGVDWEQSRAYRFSAETFYTRFSDLLSLDNETTADREIETTQDAFATGGTGWSSGLELFAERRTGPLTGWIGYTLAFTRRTFDNVNAGAEYAPKYDRRHDLKAVASWQRGKWTYGAVFVLGTGQAFTPATARYRIRNPATGEFASEGNVLPGAKNSGRLLPYHRLDVSLTRQFRLFGQAAEWSLQIFNLYNRRNEWFVQFDPAGEEIEPEIIRMLPLIPSLGLRFQF